MGKEFQALAELCEKLEETSKRNLMVKFVSDFLTQLNENEIEPAVSMMLGRPFSKGDKRTLDISWKTLSSAIMRLTKVTQERFAEIFKKTGDLGSTVKIVFESSRAQRQVAFSEKPLTIVELRKVFEAIAEASGHGSRERKERLIEALLGRATPLEAKYIVKIMIGEMRTGFHEGLMELAVSRAFHIPQKTIERAVMFTGSIETVAAIAKTQGEHGVLKVQPQVFKPIKPMLAQMAEGVNQALIEHGETAFEHKLDGARIQIHKLEDDVKIYSRRLADVTTSLPEIVELIKKNIKANEVIMEGEVIAVGEDDTPLPFQHLMRRFRRIHEIEEKIAEIPLKLYLFDLIYLNGKSLIDTPYVERRKMLKKIAGGIPLTEQLISKNLQEAEHFLEEAVKSGHEGLIAKRLDSPYTPGIRGKHWLKIKKTLEPLDLVIVAAEYGYGRRKNWLSDYYLAARDEKTGNFLIVGKTFKGLTDEEIIQMTQRLKEISIKETHRKVVVIPKIVVEVAYNEIQKSPKYKSGVALRFARITRIRDDKSPEEADTLQRILKIYEKQFERKAKL